MRSTFVVAAALLVALSGMPATGSVASCSGPGSAAMPDGSGHDHADASQHDVSCGIRSEAYVSLRDLVPEAVDFGESDVAGDIVAMAVAYPEAGFVLFDVSGAWRPRALSRFRSEACEVVVIDYDCGADVKLSSDGTLAFLALQKTRVPPGEPPGTTVRPTRTGIVVVDISSPSSPREIGFTPIAPRGTHLLDYWNSGDAEYVYAVHNGVGFSIYRLTRPATLRLVADVKTKGAHDITQFFDPIERKNYLYLSGANAGLFIYDLSEPARPKLAGRWIPAPERPRETWYVHSAVTVREGNRRLTLVGPELSQPGMDHGALAAPLWLLDTTDHANPQLIGEWRNQAGRAAGALGFSVHNFTFANGVSWVAHYHGGVWLLDWSGVFDGISRTPSVTGVYLPNESSRPFVNVRPRRKFLSLFETKRRPMVWDVVADGRHAYVSDITGGFSVLSIERAARESNGVAYLWVALAGCIVVAGLVAGMLRRRRRARL